MVDQTRNLLLEEAPNTDLDNLIPSLNHKQAVHLSFSQIEHIVDIMQDLDYKLIINKTKNPFIGSDFPVVKYNRFLEKLNWDHSKTGYGTIGLQIFIPLNHKIMIIFFDRRIYKVGNRKDKSIELEEKQDVDKLNELQYINCFTTLFFNEDATENYLNKLIKKASKYERANVATTKMSYLLKPGENIKERKRKNLIVTGSTECETKLEINGIKLHSGSKKAEKRIESSNSVAHLRPRAHKIMDRFS